MMVTGTPTTECEPDLDGRADLVFEVVRLVELFDDEWRRPMQPVNPDEATPAEAAFAEIPLSAARPGLPGRGRRVVTVAALVAAVVIGLLAAYFTRPAEVDPNAPRVVAEVTGMDCPIQCGLRVASTLEKLPFVVPCSVTANPQTGTVTFAVTSVEAVDQEQIRRAVEKAGFGVRSVRISAPRGT